MSLSGSPATQHTPYGFGARLVPLCAEPVTGVSQAAHFNLPCALSPLTPESPAVAREYLFTADGRLRLL